MTVPTLEVPPSGFTFSPKDGELIEHYLVPKVRGEQRLYLSLIPELDVYATEPWNLGIEFRHGRNRDAFFCFTRVTRSGASNGRLLRSAGNGTWHSSGQRMLIRSKGMVIGQKMTNLKFMIRPNDGGKPAATSWIMHEYRLLDPPIDDQGRELVLYRIQKSGKGLSDDHQLSCLVDFPASTANPQALRKRKRDQMHCYEMAVGTMMSCSTLAPLPRIAGDEQLQSASMSVWEDPTDIVDGWVIQSQPLMQLPCSGDDANPVFCSEIASRCPVMRTMMSCSIPPPCIVGDEHLQSTSKSVWEHPIDIVDGSVIKCQPMMQLPCSGDDATLLFYCEIAARGSAMRPMMSCNTPPPCIVGDEQLESTSMSLWEDPPDIGKVSVIQSEPMTQPPCSGDDAASVFYHEMAAECPEMRTMTRCSTPPPCIVGDEQQERMTVDCAPCFSMLDWEDSADISNELVIQPQPMIQSDHAQQPERNMIESATDCSTANTTLWESDWNEADLRMILEMIEKTG